MTTRLAFARVAIHSFRNIRAIDFEPAPGVNVITGDNGQGKTSLLEALYFVATSQSFRAEKLAELVQQGSETATVRATLVEDEQRREQRASVGPAGRSLALDGKKPARLASYAVRTPVVVFHPGDLSLASGPSALRRKLLDRIALFFEPASADHRVRYARALRERQRALEGRGAGAADLDAYEQLMAEHGAALERGRAAAAGHLAEALAPAFSGLAPAELALEASFRAGGSDDAALVARELAARRSVDRRRGAATFGPHRDDVDLVLDGRSARRHASQGQQRLLALAIKMAELDCVRRARGAHPVLLLDDVSSELDPGRTGAVYDAVREMPSQIFVTTTRPELFWAPAATIGPEQRADFRVVAGALSIGGSRG